MAGMFPTNKEISVFGKKIKFPGVTDKGEYTNGNFENPDEPPSYLDADTQNLILHNLNNLIAQLSGKEANNTDRNQLAALFTVAATALRGVQRDAGGRAKVASPVEDDDIARKKEVDDVGYELGLHIADTSNPHEVTKAQVGLGNVDNTADKDKTVKSAGTCTGNAETANKWQTARKLNGLSIQGDSDRTNYAVCSTAAGTQTKTCDCAGFALVTGAEITVKFSATNTQNGPTLNVNGTGAKAIYYRGAAIPAAYLAANRTYTFRYNGSQYELVGDIDTDTTYSVATGDAAGLMSAADKKKLDGISAGANDYSHPTGSGNNHIPAGGSAGQILRWLADGQAQWGNDSNTTYGEATSSAAGLMSATDKRRLDGNYVTASNFGSSSGYIKYSNGLLIQWMFVSQSNREITLPTPFSSASYVALATVQMANDERASHAQIKIVSPSIFFVRGRHQDASYADECYCFFIGY